jgi:hypothetical protein
MEKKIFEEIIKSYIIYIYLVHTQFLDTATKRRNGISMTI